MRPKAWTVTIGSSPLARGLHRDSLRSHPRERHRIIPARAGFTGEEHGRVHRVRDHPRSRGVYYGGRKACVALPGSSPLARGLPPPLARAPRMRRIIPARAGFTRPRAGGHREAGDHPRSRGVYRVAERAAHWAGGSSPLARGLQRRGLLDRPRFRIIPARAGFTLMVVGVHFRCLDHPRSRGVYFSRTSLFLGRLGSSPLARGLLYRAWAAETHAGIIPARAGFTRAPHLRGR